MDSFLTVAEVATRLKLAKMTVYRLIHAGALDAVKVGKSYRVSEKAFNGYLKGARTNGNTSGRAGSKKAR
jgi:excisionase family DNA binding protein